MSDSVQRKSLSEVHSSVDATNRRGWRKLLAFLGPAYLVSVGYMDPGNWATDIAGGSKFGYSLLWVLLMSNLMALLLQSLSARLGVVRQLDLAQASRSSYHPVVNFCLWILAEIAIAACDLAEVLGMAIGLQLLFGLPLIWGVSLTVLDTLLLLVLQSYGMRKIEAFIIALVAIIGISFLMEMIWAKPEVGQLMKGFVPTLPSDEALYIAIGIIGATVMPHNLYLHSSLVQTRRIDSSEKGIWSAIKYNFIDSAIALNAAFFVNSAILILAASTFFRAGMFEVSDIQDSYKFLAPLTGTEWASILFGVALVAAGQSSTITGTLAGQVVMEGYLNLRIAPWLRRLITRLIAIIPAYVVILIYGEGKTGELLVFSQVVLSLQLGFAVIPLIHFTSDKQKMGVFAIKPWVKIAAWTIAFIIVSLNVKLVVQEITGWLANAGENAWLIWLIVIPFCMATGVLLFYITFKPLLDRRRQEKNARPPHGSAILLQSLEKPTYRKIAITIDFSSVDSICIQSAMAQGGKSASYLLLHVVETAGAIWYGSEIADRESSVDTASLQNYLDQLKEQGYEVEMQIGYGNPKQIIPELVTKFDADLLVMGAHGHKWAKDLIFGTTVDTVRHRVAIPVLIVR
ncbi:MAG: Nramp family divalent metal transporter [Cytophagales bacterium]|jgi:manganese transport protein|nr:Nramp family divalent metal transporter [Cytophagales bacterium]MCA6387326.1 Nramp family divalent metal transporter [Cytophagales bacterium]MCA6390135.1 Nramp family divalent metal transporter [Cytophagales bacterium]MCA6393593.1 Nramp family divalent metal transporter [Cytophagales bacterium]MCA6397837.1 Nramp family divalent metal transporter [Cytophagales bacterium]